VAAEFLNARIRHIGPGPVHIVSLELVSSGWQFAAGQYLNVVHRGGERIPFSVATPPSRLPLLELHFQPTPGHPQSALMIDALKDNQLQLEGPFGGTVLDKATHSSLLFVCAGSGFAQALSLIESAADNRQREFRTSILWCCENLAGVYAAKRFHQLGAGVSKHLCVDPVKSTTSAGLKLLQKLAHPNDLFDAFLCGSPGFVWAATDTLTDGGIPSAHLHSDVYDYAPRAKV
jgi:CDP-4-dehydro-6-deoxyglucose reductase